VIGGRCRHLAYGFAVLGLCLLPAAAEDESPPRYEVEVLYVIHRNVTAVNYRRLEALFAKAYPKFDLTLLAPGQRWRSDYYAIFRDRLLEEAGVDPSQRDRGFKLVRDQIDRELQVRAMFDHFLAEGRREGSLKAVFDHLVGKDDPKHPVCAAVPGGALLVYRRVTDTEKGLEGLVDGNVRFGREFTHRVIRIPPTDGQGFTKSPFVLGTAGQGRQIFRVVKVLEAAKPEEK